MGVKKKRPAMKGFLRGYVTCALWASTDDNGTPMDSNYDASDISTSTLRKMAADCLRFQRAARADLDKSGMDSDEQGHNFWLSRNGHGTGFWDRDLDDLGDRLHAKAKRMGTFDLYIGDDGKIHGS